MRGTSLTEGPWECGSRCASGEQPRCCVALRVPVAGTGAVRQAVGGAGEAVSGA